MISKEVTYAISIEGASKELDKIHVGPIQLQVEPGYVIAVVGTNGSGKSTLFRMLNNLIKPDEGSIRILDMQYPQDEVAIKQRMGYVPELEMWSALGFTRIRDLTDFVARAYPNWNQELAKRLFTRFELDGGQKLEHLSKGMKRKLAFVHAVAFEPDILLLDELTSGLDPFAWKAMMNEITAYMDGGQRTVLMATHILEEVKQIADMVAFIHKGKLLGLYEKDALVDEWKSFWLEGQEEKFKHMPGVAAVEKVAGTSTARILSRSAIETDAALRQAGAKVIQTKAVELDEVLRMLVLEQESKEGQGQS
ncbi:ABC transporter ATP-binding protein [Paenibacillus hexagrammi]|uniref:ABC transporter ATP-binding protein n=1 Tax=Paenibacillus hexagrammi TaxID=2908839 RepID=A0ABY3SJY4_9BACL|nr:ABC transporter ATP-binding protein [Paenibacillus sp. YPD9-1]UJF34157.1 ABC transporter ATP-binding protein [Paenibacillus sp. YPD9-1]